MYPKNKNQPFVSVIIPTYYDWERLQLCLNALSMQTYDQEKFEIIIVNNAPDDKAPSSIIFPKNSILLNEEKSGSYAARNKALNIAKGEIYAFTDSDCQPLNNWLEVAVEYFKNHSEIERIGGEIRLFSENEKMNYLEIYEVFFAFPQKDFVQSGMAATGNMISRKSVFDKVGVFNDSLMSGGDGEWGRRAELQGSQIAYLENCIVLHPTRADSNSIYIKNKRLAGGHILLAKEKSKLAVCLLLLRTVLPPITAMKRAFKKRDQPLKNKLLAISTYYYLKIRAAIEMIKLLLNLKSLERV